MERMEQLALELEPLLVAELESATEHLKKVIEARAEDIIDGLSDAIIVALEKAITLQYHGLKGPVTYISFSLLLSNILTERHGFQVAAFDDRFFVDTQEAVASWRPSYLFSEMDKCFERAATAVKPKIPRLQPYELMEAKRVFCLNYYTVAMQVLVHALPRAFDEIAAPTLKRADTVLVVAGLYMEKQDCIYVWEV